MLLHGEPTWSYLYRTMIPPLVEGGRRVLAPDLIGFGRSDKPRAASDYTYLRHVEWVTSWFESLDLRDVTLFVQDWGSLIGLRIAAEQSDRIARIVVANGFCRRHRPANIAFRTGGHSRATPGVPCGRIVSVGTSGRSPEVRAGTMRRSPTRAFRPGHGPSEAGADEVDDPAIPANRAAWEALGRWEKPFLCVFGARDPILGRADRPLIDHVPGAAGQPHDRINGSHFVQEDCGPSWPHDAVLGPGAG